jgi:hypothetical protein
MTNRITLRESTPDRWQAALRRAIAEGVQVRQLAGSGLWVATSSHDPGVAYEVTPWSCECTAGQFDDPVCKHRAALLHRLGHLALDDESLDILRATLTRHARRAETRHEARAA